MRNKLSGDNAPETEVKSVDDDISNIEAETNRNNIVNQFSSLGSDPENVNLSQVWKLLNKLCPKMLQVFQQQRKTILEKLFLNQKN